MVTQAEHRGGPHRERSRKNDTAFCSGKIKQRHGAETAEPGTRKVACIHALNGIHETAQQGDDSQPCKGERDEKDEIVGGEVEGLPRLIHEVCRVKWNTSDDADGQ